LLYFASTADASTCQQSGVINGYCKYVYSSSQASCYPDTSYGLCTGSSSYPGAMSGPFIMCCGTGTTSSPTPTPTPTPTPGQVQVPSGSACVELANVNGALSFVTAGGGSCYTTCGAWGSCSMEGEDQACTNQFDPVCGQTTCVRACTRNCVGSFGNNGGCTATCGTGQQAQVYSISVTKLGTGADCPFADGYTQNVPCTGPGVVDACGVCNGGGPNAQGCCNGQSKDCAGVCGGSAQDYGCGCGNGGYNANGCCGSQSKDCNGAYIIRLY
jgi:hypothetical protein